MTMVAIQNMRSVDQVVAIPTAAAAKSIQKMGKDVARDFLRYHSSELNRWYFESWETVQLVLGCLLLVTLWRGVSRRTPLLALALLMLAAVAAARWLLTPEITRLGRLMDFVPADQPSPERSRFWHFHVAYSVVEVFKLSVGSAIGIGLLIGSRHRQGDRRREPATSAAGTTPAGRD